MEKLIIANWKMNPSDVQKAVRLARAEDREGIVVAPPYPFLAAVGTTLKRAKLGAQDAFWVPLGAYTGEVSGRQLKSIGVSHVIVGHSERRALGENDAFINRKVRAVLAEGLVVVLCVGEPLSVRKKGLAAAKRFVARQLGAAWEGIERLKVRRLVVAYEPVWAIGTGRSDSPREAAEMARYIKAFTARRFHSSPLVLYGGSVTSRNARSFFHESGIDGALVGSASLKVGDFRKIVAAAL